MSENCDHPKAKDYAKLLAEQIKGDESFADDMERERIYDNIEVLLHALKQQHSEEAEIDPHVGAVIAKHRQRAAADKAKLTSDDPAGWYECEYSQGPHRYVLWWTGLRLQDYPTASEKRAGSHHYRNFRGPLVDGGEVERWKRLLDIECQDNYETDTNVRNILRPVLGSSVDGDSHSVPPLEDLVERLAQQLAEASKERIGLEILSRYRNQLAAELAYARERNKSYVMLSLSRDDADKILETIPTKEMRDE